MGELVEFPSNGHGASGYLATPAGGSGPGVIVIQEWWGLVDHIKDVCDRFAADGFTALAPDLYHGADHRARRGRQAHDGAQHRAGAAKDMGGAVDYLLGARLGHGDQVGVIGFCMGGGLALVLAAAAPRRHRRLRRRSTA